jgi:cytoskeleton protein RodZ
MAHSSSFPSGEEERPEATPAKASGQKPAYDGVGVSLRSVRLKKQIPLEKVAADLRIQRDFLAALEAGEFERLPGRVYASGFIRSYASYLDLDAEVAITAYNKEIASAPPPDPLNFPVPIPKDRIPRTWVILIGLAAAALLYGIWAYSQSGENSSAAAVDAPPAVAASTADSDAAANADTAPADEAVAPIPPAENMAVDPVADQPVDELPAPPVLPATAPIASDLPQPGAAPPSPAQTPVPAATPEPATPAATPEPVTYGAENQTGRVIVRASVDSWVQVSGSDGRSIFSQVLRPGESYRPPAGRELWLDTGNAGGLDIAVDGRAIAPIGSSGMVRRGVSLAPERLLAGGN